LVYALMDRGDVIGEIAVLDRQPRSATVVAIEPCEVVVLHQRDLFAFLEEHPSAAIQMARVLAMRIRRLSEVLADHRLLALSTRLAKKLIALALDHGNETPEGVEIDLPLAQHELADMVGSSRESVNKQLREWVSLGLVHVEARRIKLFKPSDLESMAGLTPF
jgi:CRP-like cAMP-binding protein